MNTLKEPIRTSVPLTAEKGERCEPVLKLTRILVPMDFSKTCEKALDYAVPLAREFGATITVLHAIEPPPYSMDLTYLPMGEGFPVGSIKKELEASARKLVEPELLKEVIVQIGTAFEVITNVYAISKISAISAATPAKISLLLKKPRPIADRRSLRQRKTLTICMKTTALRQAVVARR